MRHARATVFWQGVRFPLVFLGLCSVALLAMTVLEPVQALLSRFFAVVVYAVVNLAGVPTQLHDTTVLTFGGGRFSYDIAPACSALDVVLLYAAGVLAYAPASWRKRMTGLIFGTVIILGANLVRLLVLAASGVSGPPGLFEALHLYGGSISLLMTVGLTWWGWTRWSAKRHSRRMRAASAYAVPAAVLVGVPGILWISNEWWSAAERYLNLLLGVRGWVGGAIFGITPVSHAEWVRTAAVTYYAPLAGTLALLLGLSRDAWGRRVAKCVAGAAVLFGAQLLMLTLNWKLDIAGTEGVYWRVVAAGLPFALVLGFWMATVRRWAPEDTQ